MNETPLYDSLVTESYEPDFAAAAELDAPRTTDGLPRLTWPGLLFGIAVVACGLVALFLPAGMWTR